MWIFLNNAMLSIVANRDDAGKTLLVRARLRGDLERAFGEILIEETNDADYRWRTRLDRESVASMLLTRAKEIEYDNFKASIPLEHADRSHAYHQVWSAMMDAQNRERFRDAGQLENGDGWWCDTCGRIVPGDQVTNDERHDPERGGCGDFVC